MKEVRIEDTTSSFGKVSVNFTGVACELYNRLYENNEFKRLREIDHLGLIAKTFKTLSHSRYDYFITQSVMTEIVENTFRGTTTAQGSIRINGKIYRGNEVLKVWIMLSNIGHCKYTIGDEKAMMIYASKRRGFKSVLLKQLDDEKLLIWANKVIQRFDYVKFHHLLSIYRIYQLYKRNRQKQRELISIYKAFLLPSNQMDSVSDRIKLIQLKNIYKNIRNLAIISLDTANSHLPISIDILSTILSFDFNSDKFQGRKLSQLFNPLTNLLYDKIYLSTQVQTLQRSYEVRAIKAMRSLSYKQTIMEALEHGLADANECDLIHFARKEYKLASNQKLKDHFNISQQIKGGSDKFESSVDFNLLTKNTVLDFYLRKSTFEISDLPMLVARACKVSDIVDEKQLMAEVSTHEQITEILKDNLRKQGIEDQQSIAILKPILEYLAKDSVKINYELNVKFLKRLTWSIIRFFIHSRYYFELDALIDDKSIAAKYPTGEDFASNSIRAEIEKYSEINPDRVKELQHLEYAIKKRYDGHTVVCIDRVKIYDYSLAPDRRNITDIDSLVLKFSGRELIVEFNETKNMNNPTSIAIKDLREKFVKVLNSNAKGYRVLPVRKYGAKVRIRICT